MFLLPTVEDPRLIAPDSDSGFVCAIPTHASSRPSTAPEIARDKNAGSLEVRVTVGLGKAGLFGDRNSE